MASGLPSTVHAIATGGDPLEATAAAGSIAAPGVTDRRLLLAAAVPVHVALSLTWAYVLARVLPARATTLWGAAAGVVIAGIDIGVLGRRWPRIAALPKGPQLADHVAFGALVGATLARRRPHP